MASSLCPALCSLAILLFVGGVSSTYPSLPPSLPPSIHPSTITRRPKQLTKRPNTSLLWHHYIHPFIHPPPPHLWCAAACCRFLATSPLSCSTREGALFAPTTRLGKDEEDEAKEGGMAASSLLVLVVVLVGWCFFLPSRVETASK